MNYYGITFIYENIDIEGEQSIELIPGYIFRKATPDEILEIKKQLSNLNSTPFPGLEFPYEYITKEIKRDGGISFEREHLPEKGWNYWVIDFNSSNSTIHELQYSAILLEHDLDFAFSLFFLKGGGLGSTSIPSWLVARIRSFEDVHKNVQKIKSDEIKLIGTYYKKQKDISSSYPFIDHAIKNLFALRAIPEISEIVIVGYFSIIESLITHPPRLTETLDSIRHQIYNKMILLRKKFKRDISYNSYFLCTKEETIWKKLYDYRSSLAHGGIHDFKTKFQTLKGHNNVSSFLKENIKELIVFSMENPEFIKDIKNC